MVFLSGEAFHLLSLAVLSFQQQLLFTSPSCCAADSGVHLGCLLIRCLLIRWKQIISIAGFVRSLTWNQRETDELPVDLLFGLPWQVEELP